MKNSILFTLLSVAAAANAHMILNFPPPFPATVKAATGGLDNGPLSADASAPNYPCKATSPEAYTTSDRTQMALGSTFNMNFTGSAVHGGGSCQVSLTKDLKPTAGSVFKVIHSIEGGCPARNAGSNNLAGGASFADPDNYPVTIPDGLEPGQYTFAWTWFNKIGNREMYMNCAPVEITGTKSKRDTSFFDQLPDMFTANIPNSQCGTTEGKEVQFPHPGTSVETNPPNLLGPPVIKGDISKCYAGPGMSSSGSSTSSGSSDSSDSSDSSGSSDTGSSAIPSAPAAAMPTSVAPAPSFTPASPSGAQSAINKAPVPVSTAVTPAPTSDTSSAPSLSTPGASGSCLSGQMPCTGDALVCIGSSQFGLCNFGCMTPQAVAAGTTCTNGAIARKRALRAPPSVRRRMNDAAWARDAA